MLRNLTKSASFFFVLIGTLIFSLSLIGMTVAQSNTSGSNNIATRDSVLLSNATGIENLALFSIGVNPMCLLEI